LESHQVHAGAVGHGLNAHNATRFEFGQGGFLSFCCIAFELIGIDLSFWTN
jgi:hypothetical protein